jgi:putative membrane protein
MQFLKILFWCLLAFIAAIFTLGNWTSVPIKLWGGMEALINLPLLLLLTFLAGLVPTLAWHSTLRWRLRTRLAAAERALHDFRVTTTPAPVATQLPDTVVLDSHPADAA